MRFRLGRAGNIALIVALSAVPMVGLVALAIDFGRVSVVKGKLDQAADSAALLAASAASNAYKAGAPDPVAEGQAAGQARFVAQSGNQTNVAIGKVTVAVTQNGGQFNATVQYTAATQTTFARVVGVTSMPIAGQSQADLTLNPFVDIKILMDSSASMLLAATPAYAATMVNLTRNYKKTPGMPGNAGESCQFACHWSSTGNDYYQLALTNNVQLRLTVLQSAVDNVIQTLIGQDSANRFQVGLYTFNQTFNTIYPLSSDLNTAKSFVNKIQPDVNDCTSNCPDTYFDKAMTAMTADAWEASGSQSPERFLIIIGDGVYDQYNSNGSRGIGPYNPQDCAALKAMGVTILVLYTTYIPEDNAPGDYYNQYYMDNVNPFAPQIEPDLQACASSTIYEKSASDAAGIQTQLQALVQLVVQSTSHLTN